jgi:acylphosphatase
MLRALGAFAEEGLEYVLIGAAAMGVHGIVRATEDLDVFVRGTPENVARLQRALRKVYGSDPNIDQISAQDLLGEYPAIRYYPPSGDLYFDVMTRLGTAASYETVEVEEKEIAGVRVRVASPRALYLLKRDTVRAIDRQDATALARAFKLDEAP